MVFHRLGIFLINLLMPPIAVFCLTDEINSDVLLNCFLFILAVIPSHVHGFYISCVYFHRKNKVKKGKYPGGPKSLISSQKVLNGGASDREVMRLKQDEKLKRRSSKGSQRSRASSRSKRMSGGSQRVSRQYTEEVKLG